MTFWIIAGLLLVACVAAMGAALRTDRAPADRQDVAVYRDQLRELDRDAARGVLPEPEVAAARAEVARRLLAADRERTAGSRQGWTALGLALVALPTLVVSVGVYLWIGAPGYSDLPLQARIDRIEEARAARPDQASAEADVPARVDDSNPDMTRMAAQLREVLEGRPDDLRGWRLAVQTEAGLGDYAAAWRAQDRVLALAGEDATADDFALLAELMVAAADGYVSPEAERALAEALRREPANGTARYYRGLMYAQGGRPDLAWPVWRALVADSRPGDPWLDPIYARIEDVSVLAGYPTPLEELPQPRGPAAEDLAGAASMSPEDRVEMIAGMVDGLAARLADEGGPPSDWARLITSYGVLGRTDDAARVYAEAKMTFTDDPAGLDVLARAAEQAGLTP